MIHKINLHPDTLAKLKRAVQVQLDLLRCSAAQPSSKKQCEALLAPTYGTDAKALAEWVYAKNTKEEKRRWRYWRTFALNPGATQQDRLDWIAELQRDVDRLYDKRPAGGLTLYNDKTAPTWKRNGAEFLKFGYTLLSQGLPPLFVGGNTPFSRYALLDKFRENNDGLVSCPFCDESGYFSLAETETRGVVDHYFPKSKYPHLSIHPYNLVPICHICNSGFKSDRDPLERGGGRRNLQDLLLPYKGIHLENQTVLKVNLRAKDQVITKLVRRVGASGRVDETRDVMTKLFQVPERWNRRRDTIGEQMFRRLRQFLQESGVFEQDTLWREDLVDRMDRQIAYYHEEDMRREPFAYVITWWLSTLVDEDVTQYANAEIGNDVDADSLLYQIRAWHTDAVGATKRRKRQGIRLRRIRTEAVKAFP